MELLLAPVVVSEAVKQILMLASVVPTMLAVVLLLMLALLVVVAVVNVLLLVVVVLWAPRHLEELELEQEEGIGDKLVVICGIIYVCLYL